jgi:hypothetical protein
VSNDTSSVAGDLCAQNSLRLTGTVAAKPHTRHPHLGTGRAAAALLGLLTVSACATAEGPPGKSQARLNYENNICSMRASRSYRFMATETVYTQCMVSFGNTVHLPDGRTFEPQYAYLPLQYYQPSPPYTSQPPITVAPPDQSGGTHDDTDDQHSASSPAPERQEATSEPNTLDQTTGLLTVDEEKELISRGIAEGITALGVCGVERIFGHRHVFICAAKHWIAGMGVEVVRTKICSNPDILLRMPVISDYKETILGIECT